MYVSFCPRLFSTVAWYTTPCWLQAPGRGHSLFLLFMQLQDGGVLGFLLLFELFKILLLCLFTWAPIFGRHLYPTFTVCLFITEWIWCPGGKCLSINFKNSLPTFVATLRLKGGLNHVTFFFFLFLLLFGSVLGL